MVEYPGGVMTALVTPLTRDGALCSECLRSLMEFQVDRGVSGLFLTGTYGEGMVLPERVRREVYAKALEYAPGGAFLLPHVGAAEPEVALGLARAARDLGYRVVSLLGPVYHKPTRRGLVEFFGYVAGKADVDIVIYNNKNRQGYNISPDDFEEIARSVPSVVGIKDTSYDVDQMLEYHVRFGSKYFVAGAGDSMLFYTFALGLPAHICGISNALPELAVELYRSSKSGDLKRAIELQYSILNVRKVIGKFGVESQTVLREVLRWRGVDAGHPPLALRASLDPRLLEELKRTIERVYEVTLGVKV